MMMMVVMMTMMAIATDGEGGHDRDDHVGDADNGCDDGNPTMRAMIVMVIMTTMRTMMAIAT